MGILFDVDGVLLRGGSVIPAARRAFQKLVDQEKKSFRLPVVFVTNAGSCHRQHKARQLSQLLEVQVGTEQPCCYFILMSLSVTSGDPASAPPPPPSFPLSVQIAPEQVVLSHSPLQMFRSLHDKCVLVSGQGPVRDIATTYPSDCLTLMETVVFKGCLMCESTLTRAPSV